MHTINVKEKHVQVIRKKTSLNIEGANLYF